MNSLKSQVVLANKFLDHATSKGSNLISYDELKALEALVVFAQVNIAQAGGDLDIDRNCLINEQNEQVGPERQNVRWLGPSIKEQPSVSRCTKCGVSQTIGEKHVGGWLSQSAR